MAERIPFAMAIGEHERGRALTEGRVQAEGLDLTVPTFQNDGERHDKFLAGEYDACELSMGIYLTAHERSSEFTAIPVFPNRRFRHSYIFINRDSGIRGPRDLAGKRFGINSWLNTASVWVRGMLQHDHGLDLRELTWVTASAPEVEGWQPPAGIRIEQPSRKAPLADLLVTGEIDALAAPTIIAPYRQGHPKIDRLFPKYQEVEMDYFRRTGIFPVSHAIVIRGSALEEREWIVASLWKAWQQAKHESYEYTKHPGHSNLAWYGAQQEQEREIFGADAWPYDVESNRRPLEAVTLYAYEQGLTKRQIPIEELFHPAARGPAPAV